MGFEYRLICREAVVVGCLAGVMDRDAAGALASFHAELTGVGPRAVIFDMKGVSDIKSESFRSFALLAKGLKDAKTPYCYAALRSDLKRLLIGAGLISHNEAVDSLEQGLKSLLAKSVAGN